MSQVPEVQNGKSSVMQNSALKICMQNPPWFESDVEVHIFHQHLQLRLQSVLWRAIWCLKVVSEVEIKPSKAK